MEKCNEEVVGSQPRIGHGHHLTGIRSFDECYYQAVRNRRGWNRSIPSAVCANVPHSIFLLDLDVVEESAPLSSWPKGRSKAACSQRSHRLLRDIWHVLFVAVSPGC